MSNQKYNIMTRKKIYALSLLFAFYLLHSNDLLAQQPSQYTQYIFNYFGINPAAGGSTKCLQLKAGYRRQWLGFESAPVQQRLRVNETQIHRWPRRIPYHRYVSTCGPFHQP